MSTTAPDNWFSFIPQTIQLNIDSSKVLASDKKMTREHLHIQPMYVSEFSTFYSESLV